VRIRAAAALFALGVLAGNALPAAPANRLAGLPSPYLALHANDPVAWRPWNAEALAEARRRKVPLLVSVGFFACRWCHVLHRESYLDREIAALINRHFIPVKVDREIDGALDAALQEFAGRTAGRRGWPLQVLVTPEGYAAAAGFYEPPAAFRATLAEWAARWDRDPAALQRAARLASPPPPPAQIARATPDGALAAALAARFADEALERADPLRGGFGMAAKFPFAPQLLALLELYRRPGGERLGEALRLTLEQMRTQGLRDHLWGGFFRYTVDPDWREPHFEKMLADNALLALVYLRAARALDEPRYREVALETLGFMRRELRDAPSGAFASGLAAYDARGREGARYLWRSARLAQLLPEAERAAVARVWDLGSVPARPLGHLALEAVAPTDVERTRLRRAYERLRASREGALPPRDSKLLAGWNGLALLAFSEAAPHDARARKDAAALRAFVARALWDGKGLRKLAGAPLAGELEDYAFVAWGLARYGDLTADAADRALAVAVARAGWDRFFNEGWLQQERPLLAGLGRELVVVDTHLPSPSAALILASLELGDAALAARAREALSLRERPPVDGAFGWATHVTAMQRAARSGVAAASRGRAAR
jgi:uncharacterized protein YyaL (SSP411 family)